jgi:hypothetical protein
VQGHPDPDRPVGQSVLCLLGGGCGGSRVRERDEEGVTLRINFDPFVSSERCAHAGAMFAQGRRVAIGTQLVEESGGSLDVAE